MTDDTVPLDLLLGPHLAAAFIKKTAARLAEQDHLPSPVALRLACERVTGGDPLVLAATGQVWEQRPDAEDAPAQRLAVVARLTAPPSVVVTDPDQPDSELHELPIEVLHLYQLCSWDVRFLTTT